ncbi:hypothetical protein QJQ45_015306 [Haematococcus lacustris]|nr:hypothetical protein QJQ45_015306 [Haematococcus lacustris]
MSPPTTLRPTSLSSLPPPAPPPALFSPPLPATRQVTLTFRTSASVEAAACTTLTQSFAFLLLGSAANDFVDSLAPASAASSAMKLLINSVLRSGKAPHPPTPPHRADSNETNSRLQPLQPLTLLGHIMRLCESLASTLLQVHVEFTNAQFATQMVYVFNPQSIGALAVRLQLPCQTQLVCTNGNLAVTYSASNVDTSRSPPLADPDCQSLLFLMQTAVRAAGATSASPATCSVSSPSAVDGSTAASVRAALTSQAAAFRLFNVLMSPSVLASIVMPLQLPCQGTFIIISQPGTPGTTPTVFDQRAFPAQSNCGSPSPPPQPPGEDPYYPP